MFLIDAAVQNAYALYKLQNKEPIDFARARQIQIEKLGLDLIKYNVQERYNIAEETQFSGNKFSQINNMKDFLKKVSLLT